MKKLLVVPIMVVYFLWVIIVLSIWLTLQAVLKLIEYIRDFIDMIADLFDEYLFMPAKKIYLYALRIMQSDK